MHYCYRRVPLICLPFMSVCWTHTVGYLVSNVNIRGIGKSRELDSLFISSCMLNPTKVVLKQNFERKYVNNVLI